MKYLTHYIEEAQTALFNRCGCFFAFSDDQFNRQKKDGVKYVSLGAGLICPKEHISEVIDQLGKIHEAGIKQDLEENGKRAIIERELDNHEATYTYRIDDTMDALDGYGITAAEVRAVLNEMLNRQP